MKVVLKLIPLFLLLVSCERALERSNLSSSGEQVPEGACIFPEGDWILSDGLSSVGEDARCGAMSCKDGEWVGQRCNTFTKSAACQVNGTTYPHGESLPTGTCNSCSCDRGHISCTQLACQ